MNNKYVMEFTQDFDKDVGLKESKVYLLVIEPGGNYNRVVQRIDLGTALNEDEAIKKVEEFLSKNI